MGHTFHVALCGAKLILIYKCECLVCQMDPKGHTFHVTLFWAKFILIFSCEVLVCQLDPKGHTFYVALFWAQFLLIYNWEGLVCQMDPKGRTFHVALFINKRSHFSCRTFCSKSFNSIELRRFGLSTGLYLFPKQGVALIILPFFAQNFKT